MGGKKRQLMCIAHSNIYISHIIASKMSQTMLFSREFSFTNLAGFAIYF